MNQNASARSPLRAVGDEFDRAGAAIADGLCRLDRGGADLRAQLRRHAGRRRFLDHFLMAPLQRAIALAEMNGVAVVGRRRPEFRCAAATATYFSISTRPEPNADCALADRAFERGFEIGVLVDAAHAAAAAAGRRLDQHRIADLVGLLLEEFRVLPFAVIAGHDRHAGLLHQRLGAVLKPHGADGGGRRPDKDHTGSRAGFGEVGILGQKAVAGMDAFGAGLFRGRRSSVRSTDSFRAARPRRCK